MSPSVLSTADMVRFLTRGAESKMNVEDRDEDGYYNHEAEAWTADAEKHL